MTKDVEADGFKDRRSRTLPEKLYIQLEGDYKKDESEVYFFYEGFDSVFYKKYGRSVFDGFKIKEYNCKGKSNVFSLYRRINWGNFICSRVLFFTDKDYDRLIGKIEEDVDNFNVFETRYYAVENYLGDSNAAEFVLQEFLRSYYNLIETDILEEKSSSFLRILNYFCDSMNPVNAWIAYNRRKVLEGDNDYCLPLQNVKFHQVFYIKNNNKEYQYCLSKKNEESAKKHFKATFFDEEIIDYYLNIMSFNSLEFIRGKFLMQLYLSFFQVLNEDKSFKHKCIVNPIDKNIFSLLCSCIDRKDYFPEDLKQFLELNYNNIK